jgi:hypothetical protein
MRLSRLVATIGLFAAGFTAYAAYRQRSGFVGGARLRAKPEPLQRWEDEGGSVPAANLGTTAARADGRVDDDAAIVHAAPY